MKSYWQICWQMWLIFLVLTAWGNLARHLLHKHSTESFKSQSQQFLEDELSNCFLDLDTANANVEGLAWAYEITSQELNDCKNGR